MVTWLSVLRSGHPALLCAPTHSSIEPSPFLRRGLPLHLHALQVGVRARILLITPPKRETYKVRAHVHTPGHLHMQLGALQPQLGWPSTRVGALERGARPAGRGVHKQPASPHPAAVWACVHMLSQEMEKASAVKLFMPLWSLEELQDCRRCGIISKQRWGGSSVTCTAAGDVHWGISKRPHAYT